LQVCIGCECDAKVGCKEASVRFLPPVTVHLHLPSNYPAETGPNYTLTCMWLSRESIRKVRRRFDELWREASNGDVLFTWCNFLQSDLLDFLHISESGFDLQHEFRATVTQCCATLHQSSAGNRQMESAAVECDSNERQSSGATPSQPGIVWVFCFILYVIVL
jgi:hypothetical protein